MSNDILRGGWKHGPFSCEEPKTCLGAYCCPCLTYGMTEVALGHNFLAGCCLMCCVPLYPNIVQRQAVAKKHGIESNCIEDVALSCCCGLCVLAQSSKQMGEAASIFNFKMEYMTKPPTAEDMEKQRKEAADNAASAKTDVPSA